MQAAPMIEALIAGLGSIRCQVLAKYTLRAEVTAVVLDLADTDCSSVTAVLQQCCGEAILC